MSEFVNDGLFSPIDTPSLPLANVAPSLFQPEIPGVLWYPTQYESWDNAFCGETRGFYANNRWRPSWSKFQATRGQANGYKHSGIDIFAPVNTPIVAPVSGDMSIPASADDLGNRVHIQFTYSQIVWRFILGHFSSIEGAPRSVTKGEVIGYAGCSGNANNGQPCLAANVCGKFSTHVHIILRRESDQKRMDPAAALHWNLRYYNDSRDIICSDL